MNEFERGKDPKEAMRIGKSEALSRAVKAEAEKHGLSNFRLHQPECYTDHLGNCMSITYDGDRTPTLHVMNTEDYSVKIQGIEFILRAIDKGDLNDIFFMRNE